MSAPLPYPRVTALLIALAGALAGSAQITLPLGPFTFAAGVDTLRAESDVALPAGQSGDVSALRIGGDDVAVAVVEGSLAVANREAFGQRIMHLTFDLVRAGAGPAETLYVPVEVDYSLFEARLTARSVESPEPTRSVLADGTFYRVAVDEDGVYRLDEAYLTDLGLDLAGTSPRNVRVYSKGGAMLPELVGEDYPTDLQEVALVEVGNGDDRWDAGDRLLFYGEGEDVWGYDPATQHFARAENLYSEQTYYYVTVGGDGLRAAPAPAETAARYAETFTALRRIEEDRYNFLYQLNQLGQSQSQGSGQPFYGFAFATQRSVSYGPWDFGELANPNAYLTAELAASPLTGGTRFDVSLNGQRYRSTTLAAISSEGRTSETNAGSLGAIATDVRLTDATVAIEVRYDGNTETNPGWLDYVQLEAEARLQLRGAPLRFRSVDHAAPGSYGFSVRAPAGTVILDITDPLAARQVTAASEGDRLRFGYRNVDRRPDEFLAFDPGADYPTPERAGEAAVANTNLHAITSADMLVVYGEGLGAEAKRLADHRREFSGLEVEVASMADVANEFGGGRMDPTAIRALAQMIRSRDAGFRYLLLFGDGSFDPRNIHNGGDNLVATWETTAWDSQVDAYPCDDYFALLNAGEGRGDRQFPTGDIDIAVGRIPASDAAQARNYVDKVIAYDKDPALLGEWRLRTVSVADDEDANRHVRDMDEITELTKDQYPQFNREKVYADAFEQVPTAGGIRIPQAAESITRNMVRGNLVITYLGHGGANGWAQERILNSPDIENWNGQQGYPLCITATCTFTGFDDPTETVAGERVLFKRGGGAIGSFSTVRPVYVSANKQLAEASMLNVLDPSLTQRYGIGELLALSKFNSSVNNNRKYALFGDPSLKLGVPELRVAVTSFDSVDVTQPLDSLSDTVSVAALRAVELRGEVRDTSGRLVPDFNGEVVVTVYDQFRTARTLGQDPGSQVQEFERLGSTLFSGRATVTDGRWKANFILPEDLSLARGQGRISLYARSPTDLRDGAGAFDAFIVDGTLPPAIDDATAPQVEVYIDDESFAEGDLVTADPVLLVKLSDDNGINVSGAAIGHDLTAKLRGPEEATYVLNDFYQANTDDYRAGEVRYPLFDLPEGEYELEVRAWDVANNSALTLSRFIVAADAGLALERVLNYPNPFVDNTCFQFEHNAAGREVEIQVDVYTTGGRLVRSLREERVAAGTRFGNDDCVAWDGLDEYGQRLARGVYLYKVKMRTLESEAQLAESGFEKLVVLR